MNALLKTSLVVAGLAIAAQASAQITFYENDYYDGRSFTTSRPVGNFERYGFNDRSSSVVVLSDRWEVCENERFEGRCVVLRPGRYPSLSSMGLNDRVSSVRPVTRTARVPDDRFAPVAEPVYDNRRRNNERLFEAQVTSVRAVVGRAEQRCWIEREQVGQRHALRVAARQREKVGVRHPAGGLLLDAANDAGDGEAIVRVVLERAAAMTGVRDRLKVERQDLRRRQEQIDGLTDLVIVDALRRDEDHLRR